MVIVHARRPISVPSINLLAYSTSSDTDRKRLDGHGFRTYIAPHRRNDVCIVTPNDGIDEQASVDDGEYHGVDIYRRVPWARDPRNGEKGEEQR